MNTQAASTGCPDPETISAVFDGEIEPDESLRTHLNACPDCARRLADYAALRTHVSRTVASEPDESLNARIAAFVRAEAGKTEPARVWKNDPRDSRAAWGMRIAALLMLSVLFVYLLADRIRENRAGNAAPRTVASAPASTNPVSVERLPSMSANPDAGRFVRASRVSGSSSVPQYRIDIAPALIPDELGEIPEDEHIPVPFFSGMDDAGAPRRILLHGDPALDAMQMLESIRRDLTALNALDVPGLTIEAESRDNSLLTTIRMRSSDMKIRRTDDMFEFFLMGGESSGDGESVSFQIEFFCE